MGRTTGKWRKKLICPSCNTTIHFRPEKDHFGACPRCGEWLIGRGRWNRHGERLDGEPSANFDEGVDWERSRIDEIN